MYRLLHSAQSRVVVTREALTMGAALVIAEFFYKFHSFTLEAVAFLATWFALSWGADRILDRRR